MRLYHTNQVDPSGIELYASSNSADTFAGNAGIPLRKVVWKTGTSTAAEWLDVRFSAAKTITSMCLVDHTLQVGDTVTLKANSSISFASPPFSQSVTITAGMIGITFAAQTYQYWRLEITKASAGVSRQVGCIMLGSYYDTPEQPDYDGYEEEPVDLSRITKTPGGQSFVDILPVYTKLTTKFSHIDQTFSDNLLAIFKANGINRSMVIVVDPAGALSTLWYVRFSGTPKRTVTDYDASLRYNMKLDFEEQL